MQAKEAKARIKINRLIEESGWRLMDGKDGKANVVYQSRIKITRHKEDTWGEDFQHTTNGFIDYLLLDDRGFPLVVFEAKSESKNPLAGKEQALKYARSRKCRFVLLSNVNIHYFRDLEKGNPNIITRFREPSSINGYYNYKPGPQRLLTEPVRADYNALTQKPQYSEDPLWKDENQREVFFLTSV